MIIENKNKQDNLKNKIILKSKKLTPKQELFCSEYLVDLNSTKASIRAGYSKKTANKIWPELLGKTSIKNRIEILKKSRIKRVDLTSDMIVNKIYDQFEKFEARQNYTDKDGNLRIESSWTMKALELLGKHLWIFTEKHEVKQIWLLDIFKKIEENKKDKIKNDN